MPPKRNSTKQQTTPLSLILQPTNKTPQPCPRYRAKATPPAVSGKVSSRLTFQSKPGQLERRGKPLSYLCRWFDCCGEQQTDLYNPSVTTVLDFLVRLHEKVLTYTTLIASRSAVSLYLIALNLSTDTTPIKSHLIVS
ncbi:hypothetical protein P5673_031827 [Acropora cervicornis]|uniref:Uncharacterized protein n=1 Tax=Acropora cervicornis TaxID=6130 RepID=A0AAD9US82_ACRCE|nr:hypothetical protein P5673_031827 [Acropora cervicornis]